jgi:hypothetical protein
MRSGADAILRLQGRLPRPQIGLKLNLRALQKRRSEIGREKRRKTLTSMSAFLAADEELRWRFSGGRSTSSVHFRVRIPFSFHCLLLSTHPFTLAYVANLMTQLQ